MTPKNSTMDQIILDLVKDDAAEVVRSLEIAVSAFRVKLGMYQRRAADTGTIDALLALGNAVHKAESDFCKQFNHDDMQDFTGTVEQVIAQNEFVGD